MGSPFWKGQGGFRLKQNNTLFLCSFLPETETLLKCGAGALTASYLPVTASFQWFSYQPRRCRAFTVRTCLAAFSGCGVIKAAGILLLKTKNKKKHQKTLNSLEQAGMSAAVSHQNQFKKQSLQNMLIHADRCSTAVTTGRLWCLAEGLCNGKWKDGWQSEFIKEQGGLELEWRGKERTEEGRTRHKILKKIYLQEEQGCGEPVTTMTFTVIVSVSSFWVKFREKTVMRCFKSS